MTPWDPILRRRVVMSVYAVRVRFRSDRLNGGNAVVIQQRADKTFVPSGYAEEALEGRRGPS